MSSNITGLKTFVAGETIKASDTNSNNVYLENKIELAKSELESKIDGVSSSLTPFALNNILYDNGVQAFLTIDEQKDSTGSSIKILHAHAPFTYTTGNRVTVTVNSDVYLDITDLDTETKYNVFCDYNETSKVTSLALIANTVTKQEFQPSSMSVNDIWVNTQEPVSAYIKTVSNIELTNKTLVATLLGDGIELINEGILSNLKDKDKALLNSYGVAPSCVKHKDIQKGDTGFKLTWTDPDDTVTANGSKLVEWDKTVIVRKLGSYPTTIYDGDTVVTTTTRNIYSTDAYVDEVDNTLDYKYRAFPTSKTGIYSTSDNNKFGSWIYGYVECLTESNEQKRITYIEDNEYFEPSYMNFTSNEFIEADWAGSPFYSDEYLTPCMVYNGKATDTDGNSLNGEIMEFLNPNDLTKTIDGSTSHVADTSCNANAMMRKKTIYTYYKKEGNYETIKFSNVKHSDEWECWQTLKADGTYEDYYYTSIYECGLVNNVVRSISGLTPINSQSGTKEITYARNNGDGWDTDVECDGLFERRVCKLLFKRTNSQKALGEGKSNGGSNSAALLTTGTMNTKGNNWGSSSNASGIKFRGRENFWGSRWDRYRGHVIINGVPYVKMTKHTGDGSTTDDYNTTGSGYITVSGVPSCTGSSGGYGSGFTSTKYGDFATTVSGSATTYQCDGRYFDNAGTIYPCRGGGSGDGSLCGAFTLYSRGAVSSAYWDIGSALSYKPSSRG